MGPAERGRILLSHRWPLGEEHGYRTPKEVRRTWEDARESEASTKSRGLG
jgi:hypothetical protein